MFQNAEELTEEGLPFLILFHAPEDTDSMKKYTALVHSELADQRRECVCITYSLVLLQQHGETTVILKL